MPAADELITWLGDRSGPLRVGLVLLPDFTLLPPMAMIEAMRQANLLTGRPLFEWELLSPADQRDGRVSSSSGIEVATDAPYAASQVHLALVCGGVATHAQSWSAIGAWLRRRVAGGLAVGALCTGAYVLGRARLLDNRRCTVHWWNIPTLAEAFPRAWVSRERLVFDRGVLTCSGGVAPAQCVVQLVKAMAGRPAATSVASHLLLETVGDDIGAQPDGGDYAWHADDAAIAHVVQAMEAHADEPLPLARLAAIAGISERQLERRIRQRFDITPVMLYRRVRLRRARRLLLYGPGRVQDIAAASGFRSMSSFTRDYKAYFGLTPTADRHAFPRLFSLKGRTDPKTALALG